MLELFQSERTGPAQCRAFYCLPLGTQREDFLIFVEEY
jgi:hypothetical protein